MIIDSHQHYWKLSRGDYNWLTPDMVPLYQDFLPKSLKPCLDRNGIVGTVVVQAAATEDETRFLLDLAKSDPTILGVVGWVDFEAKDVARRLERLVDYGEGYLKGVRPMIQDIGDTTWVGSSAIDAAFHALADMDLTFDALVKPIHLPTLHARLQRHSSLKTIIDHCAKPNIAQNSRSRWSSDLARLAELPNVYCKLSGLVTETGPHWDFTELRPYIADVRYHFGAERLMWGSDWPVLKLKTCYSSWIEGVKEHQKWSQEEFHKIFYQNAVDFYNLQPCEVPAE